MKKQSRDRIRAGSRWRWYALYSQDAAIVEGVAQLRTITRPAPAVEAERAVGEQGVNEVLVPAFEEARLVTDADRVSFYSGHNNSGGLGGDHWVYYDLRQVAAADGVLVDEAGEVNLRSSLWSVVEQKVNPASAPAACAKWEVADIPSSSLRNRLKARGEMLIYACGMVDAAGVPRGFLPPVGTARIAASA